MAEPIYKFFMSRFLEPWYELSEEEQDSLVAKLHDALRKIGGTQSDGHGGEEPRRGPPA
jgi:hypothetical protein